jgi:hypothetical protein
MSTKAESWDKVDHASWDPDHAKAYLESGEAAKHVGMLERAKKLLVGKKKKLSLYDKSSKE